MDVEKAANKVPEAARCIIVSGQLNKANKERKIITFESRELFGKQWQEDCTYET